MSGAERGGGDVPASHGDLSEDTAARPLLFSVPGGATAEEVAALTVVLQAVAATEAEENGPAVVSEWSAHHRKVRSTYPSGPGGWRASALPR